MEIMTPIRDQISTDSARTFITALFDKAKKLNDHRMYSIVLYSQGIWQRVRFDDLAGGIEILKSGLEYAEKFDCTNEKVELLIELGIEHKDIGLFEKGFSYFMMANDIIKQDPTKILRAADFIVLIGDFYYRLGYYEKAAEYFSSLPVYGDTQIDDWHKGNYYNTAGLTFKKLKQYDMALDYFNKSLEIMSRGKGNPIWIALITGNIGSVYYERGERDKAIPLMEKDMSMSYSTGSFASAANAAQFLGKIYLEKKDYQRAEGFYYRALLIDQKGSRLSLVRDVNEGLAKLYEKKGSTTKALAHYRKFIVLRDSMDRMNKVDELKRLELKHQYERKEQERLAQIEKLRQQQEATERKQYAIVLGGMSLIALMSLGFYANRQRMKRKRVEIEKELELNKQALQNYTDRLIQKTNLIEELNQQLDNIRSMGGRNIDVDTELVTQLIDSTI